MWRDIRSLGTLERLRHYIGRYRWEILWGAVALLITDFLGLITPWLIKGAIDALPRAGSARHFLPYALLILVVAVLQAFFRYIWRRYLYGFSRKVEYELRNAYFTHLQGLSCSFFQHAKTGDLMSRATNDLGAVREFLGMGVLLIVDTLVTISTCLVLMVVIDPRLTLLALLPMPLVSILVAKIGRKIRSLFAEVQAHLSQMSSLVQESLAGIRLVQAYVREEGEEERFERVNRDYLHKNLQLTQTTGFFYPLLGFILGLSAVIVLWVGGREVIAGRMSLGSWVAFNGYLMMLTWPMVALGYMVNLVQRGSAALQRIDEVFRARSEIMDGTGTPPAERLKGEIEFREVDFVYYGGNPEDSSEKTLAGISFRLEAGSTLGVVGAVGSGKSTLARLIPRLYEPCRGKILLDGEDIRRMPLRFLRENIGYVDQEPFIFSDTIAENIAFGGQPGELEELWEAATVAGLAGEIQKFPQGLETTVGERGVTLSGGQKQRLALARAILRRPPILILDDSFSSLDAQTEEEVCVNLKEALPGSTLILITHRVSAVREADVILVLEGGRIVERGTHRQLVSLGGTYTRLFWRQQWAQELEGDGRRPEEGVGPQSVKGKP